jgi:hypothetical protein
VRSGLLDDHDPVGVPDGRHAVRDDERRAPAHDVAEASEDLLLGVRVNCRQRVVEHQDRRVEDDRARDRRALFLPARQREPPFAHLGRVALREVRDVLVEPRHGRRSGDALVGGLAVGQAERDVAGEGVGEQERLLRHDRDRASQRAQRILAHVDAVDEDGAGRRILQPRQQVQQRRLASTGRPHERDRLAGPDRERHLVQHRPRGVETEGQPAELDRTGDAGRLGDSRHRRVGDGRGLVDYLAHPPPRRHPRCIMLVTQPNAIIGQLSIVR